MMLFHLTGFVDFHPHISYATYPITERVHKHAATSGQRWTCTASVGRDYTKYGPCNHSHEKDWSTYHCVHTAWLLSMQWISLLFMVPSILQCSIPLLRAQKIPQQLTVSLKDC